MITINLWYVLKMSAKWLLILLLLLRHIGTGLIIVGLAFASPVFLLLHIVDTAQTVFLVWKIIENIQIKS